MHSTCPVRGDLTEIKFHHRLTSFAIQGLGKKPKYESTRQSHFHCLAQSTSGSPGFSWDVAGFSGVYPNDACNSGI